MSKYIQTKEGNPWEKKLIELQTKCGFKKKKGGQ